MSLLSTINSPAELRNLSTSQLPALAVEIRERLIDITSKVGGHLASNLGVVELTLALHYAFDTPNDKIIWDTGNQSYTHKLITGRRDTFHTLRQFGGISGFCKREESEFDVFNAGHAGTGVSAGVGIAEARGFLGQKYKVITIVGDGALTAGMTYEGLNHAGMLQHNSIVILNDNKMSISRNVGAISAYLNRTITGSFATWIKAEAKTALQSIPRIGEPMLKMARRAKESAKGLILPGLLFEELGFRYVGPIEGHDFNQLLPILEHIGKLSGPTLLHVVTKKGTGYEPATKDPVWFHACSPFDRATGKPKKDSSTPSYTSIASNALIRQAKKDSRIIAVTAAMAGGTGLDRFAKAFPSRFYDVGIAEQHAVTFAAGLASQGMRPVVGIYSTFLQRAFDQVLHDVAIQNLPVFYCIDRGGLVAEDGATHHGVYDLAFLRHIPNMTVMAPKDENELQHMIYTGLTLDGPASVRYPRGSGLGVPLNRELKLIPIGKGELLQSGRDIAIIAIGAGVAPAMQAAQRLKSEGIVVTVVNARFVKPLDIELITTVASEANAVITVEDGVLQGGFGSAVLECLADHNVSNIRIKRVGIPDIFVDQGPQHRLREQCGITADGIYHTAKELHPAFKNEPVTK
ncbi:MAG: 1-deoxy-D-xylulose-5-phosphate synthase [Nitrospiraceae bacterium]|nr:1-deoxy-D-xylulose-5-phosphate synthase [Nitrospiraceae bacterium]